MKEVFYVIKEQRKSLNAPVDTMGCSCIPFTENNEHKKFRVLLMLLLSVQTIDKTTYNTVHNLNAFLKRRFNEGISPLTISSLTIGELNLHLKPVNFHIKKTKNLMAISEYFLEKNMPTEYDELVKLPGVGNKIAFLYLQIACGKSMGIGVDTHVHRIFNRLGVVNSKTPEGSRIQLENIYKRSEWREINKVMVGFGQTVCLPRRPRCNECAARLSCKFYKNLEF